MAVAKTHVPAALRLAAALLLTGALLTPRDAAAQQRDTTTADSARARLVRHAPVIVTAGRTAPRPEYVGSAFTTITAADLAARQPATAADALRTVTGAFIDEAVGPAGPAIVRLRGGEEVFTQIMLDGVVINQNGGFFDFQGVPLTSIDRIEIVRGPQSALYGSSAVSGVVQLLSPRGLPGPARVELQAEGGGAASEGGNYRAVASASGGTPALRYAGGIGTSYERGHYALPHDTRSIDGSIRLDATPGSRIDLTTVARFIGVDANHPVRDAGVTRAPLDPNASVDRDRMIGIVRAHLDADRPISHELSLSAYREFFIYFDRRDDVAADRTFPFFIFDANIDFRSTLVRPVLEYVGRWRPHGTAASFAAAWGGQLQRESLHEDVDFEGDLDSQSIDRNAGALFAEFTLRPISRLAILAGARIERFGHVTSDVTPRASAVFTIDPNVALRIAAGSAYKAPNLQEQYVSNPFIASNPDLEPETSTSVEAGLDIRLLRGRVALGATAFRQRFDNLIRTVDQEGTTLQINRNLGASRVHGIEWELRVVPATDWLLGIDGATLATRVLDNTGLSADNFPVGEPLPFRPELTAHMFVEAPLAPRLTAMLRGSFVGEQIVLTERFSGERRTIDGYMLLGANARYAFGNRIDVYMRADNLLNVTYDTAWDRPGAPARFALGVAWQSY